jgi:hypothetical protein
MKHLAWEDRLELAERFAPHLVLFPENEALGWPGCKRDSPGDYHPRGVGPLIERSLISLGPFQASRPATLDMLEETTSNKAELKILGNLIPDPKHAWQSYFKILNDCDANGATGLDRFPISIYAHVQTRAEAIAESKISSNILGERSISEDEVGRPLFKANAPNMDSDISIQYWFCYYYDDWANQHEGDWEGVSIFLHRTSKDFEAVGAAYYAHETGRRRHWIDVERSAYAGDHPLVFVALGSHASYFQYVSRGYTVAVPGYVIPLVKIRLRLPLTSDKLDLVADKDQHKPISPGVLVLPDPIEPTDLNDPAWEHAKWLRFPGSWGMRVLSGFGYGGPLGPSHKGLKWHNSFAWMERHTMPDFLVL